MCCYYMLSVVIPLKSVFDQWHPSVLLSSQGSFCNLECGKIWSVELKIRMDNLWNLGAFILFPLTPAIQVMSQVDKHSQAQLCNSLEGFYKFKIQFCDRLSQFQIQVWYAERQIREGELVLPPKWVELLIRVHVVNNIKLG